MKLKLVARTFAALLCALQALGAEEAEIVVHADQPQRPLSRYLLGACIEDVNHEIYGGLYSQMIFGESFQEPEAATPLKGFTAFGGRWTVHQDELWAEGGDGPKLVCEAPAFAEGELQVELLLPQARSGNAGLIVKLSQAGVGADRFSGYEISLSSAGRLVLGRHRQNWEPIREVPCAVPTNEWIRLTARMTTNRLEVLVNEQSVLTYEDAQHPLERGQFGLRTWQREARFRNLVLRTVGSVRQIPFQTADGSFIRGVSGMWRGFRNGSAKGEFSLETSEPFLGQQSQWMSFKNGEGEVGIENRGLNRWGMNFVAGKKYEGFVWLRAERASTVTVALKGNFVEAIEDGRKPAGDHATYCEAEVKAKPGEWRRYDFTLTPKASDKSGCFAIKLKEPGSVCIGHAFLQPGEWGRFKGLRVRHDIAEGLVQEGITVLRYGGSMVNHPEYRWEKMIGPPDRRPPYHGTWYPQSSNGWGIFDFLSFCEAAGFAAIPAVNMDEHPQEMASFIDYANGSTKTRYGRMRAADGHRKPYRLKYLELGNEEAIDETYWRKFKLIAEAIWEMDSDIILIVGDFAYDKVIQDPYNFSGAPRIKSLAAHKKILDLAREHDREVWFDVHIGTEQPPAPNGLPGVRSFIEQLGKLSPGAKFKVAIFEFNANNHSLKRALANALAVNQIERFCPEVAISCSANCLQPWHQNDNGWNQGLLFFTPSQVWPQPPYFVIQMLSRNLRPMLLNAEVHCPERSLDVTATRDEHGGAVNLQVVNMGGSPVSARIRLEGFASRKTRIRATTLTGDLEGANTPEEPHRIKPVEHECAGLFENGAIDYNFVPHSFTILRIFQGGRESANDGTP